MSFPNLLHEFETYGLVSNLKINFGKSEAMGLEVPPFLQTPRSNFKFRYMDSALKYLGTHIPSRPFCIFGLRFPPLLSKTHTLLELWHQGMQSWFGRCNLIKMCTLPKISVSNSTIP